MTQSLDVILVCHFFYTGANQFWRLMGLGQISRYMYDSKMKYGFLTTYDETIFLKQAPHPTKPQTSALWFSTVIRNHQNGRMVSLRECMLYLGLQIQSGGYRWKNSMAPKSWVGSLGGQYTDDDRISPEEDNTSQVQSSSPVHRRDETERSTVTR